MESGEIEQYRSQLDDLAPVQYGWYDQVMQFQPELDNSSDIPLYRQLGGYVQHLIESRSTSMLVKKLHAELGNWLVNLD